MGKRTRIGLTHLVVLAVAGMGYLGYVGAEGSRRLVEAPASGDCRTPDVQFGWAWLLPFAALRWTSSFTSTRSAGARGQLPLCGRDCASS